jgi:peptidoglycan/xylan/chitin deacetylase (PgdA/CDA1 family)
MNTSPSMLDSATVFTAPARRLLAALLLVLPLATSSCDRIKQKLDRLAAAGQQTPAPAAEPPLTEEEKQINATLDNNALFDPTDTPAEVPKAEAFELNKASVVSILGYHDFKERGGEAMVISETKFREQMQFIKDSNIPVIPLNDVLAWKKGTKNIPEESFVITMDDGWEGVYKHAWPILKEHRFPFTIYLYKKYVNIGGRSLSWAQIKEMMDSGLCTVGSHSVSHDSMTARKGRTDEAYAAYLDTELKDSKVFLEQNLNIPMTSFAYPYGNYNTQIRDMGIAAGYETLLTVNGSKVTWDTHLGDLGRFIIHGVNDSVFRLATSFRGRGGLGTSKMVLATAVNDQGQPIVKLTPRMGSTIPDRTPRLAADLSGLGPIVPDSIKMHIAGLGSVTPVYDAATQLLSYQIPHRIRRDQCEVSITFSRANVTPPVPETLVWQFKIDLAASYLPRLPLPANQEPQP